MCAMTDTAGSVWAVVELYSPPPRDEEYWSGGDAPDGDVVVALFTTEQTAKQWIDTYKRGSSAHRAVELPVHNSLKTARKW